MANMLSALSAVALIAIGLTLGLLLRSLTARLLRLVSIRLASSTNGVVGGNAVAVRIRTAVLGWPTIAVARDVVFWLVFVFFLAAATETLGVSLVSTWLTGLVQYLPRLVAAIVVVLLGLLLASLARHAVAGAGTSAGIGYAELLGRLVQATMLMVTAVIAFDQLGIQTTFIVVIATLFIGSFLGAAAIAFGLGAQTAVSNIVARHYLLKSYRIGHRVRIGNIEGSIVEVLPTAIVIESPEGRVLVPAKEFEERPSVLVTGDGGQ